MPAFPPLPDGNMFGRFPTYALWLGVVILSATAAGAQQTDDQAVSTDWLRSLAEGGTSEGHVILLDQAMQGHAEAQYALAVLFRGGAAIPRDMEQARHWYQAVAAQGHQAALESLRYLASEGDGAAFYALGVLSRDGLGVPRDPESARQAFFWGGKEGHILAHFAAADMLLDGVGGDVDEPAALARYQQVSHLAQFALNLCAAEENANMGAPKRRAQAQYWIGKLYLTGGGGLEQSAVEAALWLENAAKVGLDVAQYELGRLYLEGRGVPRDAARALAWLEAAAAQGMNSAAEEIERIGGQE